MTQSILLTGATGYVGRHLFPRLLASGYQLFILKRPGSDLTCLDTTNPALHIVDSETDGLLAAFRQTEKIDVVIHLATCYGKSGESASEMLRANFELPARLLEAAIEHGTDNFINADTYFNVLPLGGTSLDKYALSKGIFHAWAVQAARESGIRFINLRLEHLYGPQDSPAKFVNWLVLSLLANPPALALSTGLQERDFIYIDDVVEAFSAVIAHIDALPRGHLEIGVGTGHTTRIRDFVEMAAAMCQASTRLDFGTYPMRPHEILHSVADLGALRRLGWQPRTSLADGMRQVIQYAHQHSVSRESKP